MESVKELQMIKQEEVKLREFKEGELVLFRVPGLYDKLSQSSEGPGRELGRLIMRLRVWKQEGR